MAYTTHGFHIPGTGVQINPPLHKGRCGGLWHCSLCSEEANHINPGWYVEKDQETMLNMRQNPLSEDAELRIAAMELSLSYHANKEPFSSWPESERDIVRSAEEFYKFLAGK